MTQAVVHADHGGVTPSEGHGVHQTNTGVSNPKLAIWVFLASESLFFGAFISTYFLYRGRDEQVGNPGPKPRDLFNIPFTLQNRLFCLELGSFQFRLIILPFPPPGKRAPSNHQQSHGRCEQQLNPFPTEMGIRIDPQGVLDVRYSLD